MIKIITSNHLYKDISIPIKLQGLDFKRVIVENDVWIGIGTLIVPGVRFGKGSVVAGYSVLTKDVP